MSANKFKFVSPGVFIQETDNTGVNGNTNDLGPVIIGRSERGPALRPVKVNSFSEFVETFGNPIAGNQGGDIFRDGNYLGPTYGAYAAQAYLKSASPVTFVRLLGQESDNATTLGEAGWQTTTTTVTASVNSNGGAYGLFIAPSGSNVTGTLAAVFYLDSSCSIGLSGTHSNGTASAPATCKYFLNTGGNYSAPEFKLVVSASSGIVIDSKFDFSPTSEYFIRKVFNTNPVLCNSTVTTTTTPYWLGETFEGSLATLASASYLVGVLVPLKSGSSSGASFRKSYQEAKTGWFIGQDLTSDTSSYVASSQQKLFRLVGRNSGEWLQKNLKVSITDIKRPTDTTNVYGTFSVVVRKLSDTDTKVESVEQFNNCNLNPFSENYVAKKIGDRYETWSDSERRYIEYGDHDNRSRFIRVEMDPDVAAGAVNTEYLPFGFLGPVRFKPFVDDTAGSSFVSGGIDVFGNETITDFISGGVGDIAFKFPSLRLRLSASEGNITDKKKAYFGIDTTFNSSKLNESVKDSLRIKPASVSDFDTGVNTEYSCVFSLDDVSSSSGVATWNDGCRAAGTSYRGTNSYNNILETLGVDRFTTVFYGGFDGLDIKEKEPFRNTLLTGKTELSSYAFNSLKVAIDCLRDPEVVEFSVACMPGITNSGLQTSLIDMCEQRADALALCDLEGDYEPETESTTAITGRLGSVSEAVSNLRSLGLNSSYGAFYYNWVQTKDTNSGATLWVPPTVPVLGAFGYTKKVAQVWFAPAGFTRGGLTNGAGGIPVTSVRQKLTKTERDKLYDARINPIASFPAEGIVVYGQKTVKATASALDRVNVRMLTNAVKKQISRFAATLLFEPNVQTTWARFTSQAEPYLLSVKAGLGIEGYKLILDESTTTPDLVDRNIIYAKLAIWPTKSAEFFAIDVELTNNGAGFDD